MSDAKKQRLACLEDIAELAKKAIDIKNHDHLVWSQTREQLRQRLIDLECINLRQ